MLQKRYVKVLLCTLIGIVGIAFAGAQAWAGASLSVNPATVEMNPKAMASAKITGAGFQPDDRIVIVLVKANKGQDVPVGSADADAQGKFETTMNTLSILQGFFNMRFKEGKPAPDPNNPPLPPGDYTMKAFSWDSKAEATCVIKVTAPEKK